jgi:hypothetical protein
MELDDFLEPEVLIAVAVTAAVATPGVRRVLRQGAVYGLAGLMMAGDRIAGAARSAAQSAQDFTNRRRTEERPEEAERRSQGSPQVATS